MYQRSKFEHIMALKKINRISAHNSHIVILIIMSRNSDKCEGDEIGKNAKAHKSKNFEIVLHAIISRYI